MSLTTPPSVQKLQTALHDKAKGSPKFRFFALYDKVYRRDVLVFAYECCKANGGAAGVAGQTFEDIEGYEVASRRNPRRTIQTGAIEPLSSSRVVSRRGRRAAGLRRPRKEFSRLALPPNSASLTASFRVVQIARPGVCLPCAGQNLLWWPELPARTPRCAGS